MSTLNFLSYGSNSTALSVADNLSKATNDLTTSLQRLSSGMRINTPSDDAAGLALQSRLSNDANLYTQAIRNVNDGISMLNIADRATEALGSIITRMKELANQSANGSTSDSQRESLESEFSALLSEYDRIRADTRFNQRELLDGSLPQITVQASITAANNISFTIGTEFAELETTYSTTNGNGTFQSATTTVTSYTPEGTILADFNDDDKLDVVYGTSGGPLGIRVHLGNGNGTFGGAVTVSNGLSANQSIASYDFNSDGNLDIVATNGISAVDNIFVYLGNGNGTFQAGKSYTSGSSTFTEGVAVGDVNNDSKVDLVTGNISTAGIFISLGNGNGTFQLGTNRGSTYQATNVQLGFIDGDNNLDIIAGGYGGDPVQIYLGNGNGTFQAVRTLNATAEGATLVDINGDSKLDVVAGDGTANVAVFLGNGNGTFGAKVTYAAYGASGVSDIETADLNGDGKLDILAVNASGTSSFTVLLGNGNGTFQARTSYANGYNSLAVGDLNSDGIADAFASGAANGSVFLQNTTTNNTLGDLSVATQSYAASALTVLDTALTALGSESARIGANLSRLEHTSTFLFAVRDSLNEAVDRISGIDVATEVAQLVRSQVLQESGTAVFAQANQIPRTALALLQSLTDEE